MLSLLFVLFASDCKTIPLEKDQPAPCPGILISKESAASAFSIIEDLYPKLQEKSKLFQEKIGLLESVLKVDEDLINTLKQEIVVYKKDVRELMEFSKSSVLDHDKQQKLQTVIVFVAVGTTIILVLGVVVAVGFLAQSFTR